MGIDAGQDQNGDEAKTGNYTGGRRLLPDRLQRADPGRRGRRPHGDGELPAKNPTSTSSTRSTSRRPSARYKALKAAGKSNVAGRVRSTAAATASRPGQGGHHRRRLRSSTRQDGEPRRRGDRQDRQDGAKPTTCPRASTSSTPARPGDRQARRRRRQHHRRRGRQDLLGQLTPAQPDAPARAHASALPRRRLGPGTPTPADAAASHPTRETTP